MRKINYQSKIAGSIVGFLVVAGILFGVGFPWLLSKGTERLTGILEQRRTVLELRQEQRNIELAKQDLKSLEEKSRQPKDLFGQDITLVSDLGHLEAKAKEYDIGLQLSLTGTVGTATKAKTSSELYVIPFTIKLTGEYGDVVSYMDFLEHADTIFTVRSVNVSTSGESEVNASLLGTIYLRK